MTRHSIEQAIEDLRNGKIIIVADDEDRENEGDLVCAAELVTPELINFMTVHGRGLICLGLTEESCDQLGLTMMVNENRAPLGTAFTVSIDARHGNVLEKDGWLPSGQRRDIQLFEAPRH